MGVIQEFKKFAIRGNAFDLAVGVIIGGAFSKIVNSLISDILMPIVSAIIGEPDYSYIYYAIGPGADKIPKDAPLQVAKETAPDAIIFAYGNFLTVVLNFLLLAIVVFIMVRAYHKLVDKHEREKPAPSASAEQKVLEEIRDLMKSNQQKS